MKMFDNKTRDVVPTVKYDGTFHIERDITSGINAATSAEYSVFVHKWRQGGERWSQRKARAQQRQRYAVRERRKRQIESSADSRTTEMVSHRPYSRVSAEWSGATGGPPAEVVLRLHPSTPSSVGSNHSNLSVADTERKLTMCPSLDVPPRLRSAPNTTQPIISNMSIPFDGSGVVVRAEEALIVSFVLLLWVAAIVLFFNRWGKIRMLEPYQPKFQQQHRQSCAITENTVSVAPHHRASLSRGCVSYDCGVSFPAYQPCGYLSHRPRQNSVFVGSMALIPESPPRRTRSAADLPALSTPSERGQHTSRSSRAASLHSAVALGVCPSPRQSRAASLHSSVDTPPTSVQVHVRGSMTNINRPKSPRRLTITNV